MVAAVLLSVPAVYDRRRALWSHTACPLRPLAVAAPLCRGVCGNGDPGAAGPLLQRPQSHRRNDTLQGGRSASASLLFESVTSG